VLEVSTAVAARTPVPTPTRGRVDQGIGEITSELGVSGRTFLGITVEDWIDIGISVLIVLLGYFLAVRLLTVVFRWLARRTSTELDNRLVKHLAPDLKWLVILFFARFAILRLGFLSDTARKAIEDVFFGLGMLVTTAIGVRLIKYGITWYRDNLESDEDRERLDPLISSVQRVLYLVLVILMLSIGLAHFGIDLGVLTIGILTLAIILSLGARNTISETISGFVILVDQPFRVHDGVQLKEFDTWGDVLEIGSRTTRILTRDNREVIVPNTTMLKSQLVNYTLPDPTFRMEVDLRIAYHADLEKARQVITDALGKVDGVLPEKPVEVLFIGFSDTARHLRVRWWVANYHLQYPMLDRVCTDIDYALNRTGIEIPITTYDLNVKMQDEGKG
jgi:small-conductance mechanosensitive channel